ncbi:hypothetical protein GP486_004565 [Trichoglossum hirsutum]|uniref:UvrD-like helicase ATP-binding domain-containing protein n=1 Tax=Trichoglossum hirsutum TaxID=265104 RepID=A0A9P8LAU1_9PEZI|nr:hypothetical protein GP486_004565 [Trichoglossum hirsutum]
MANSPNPFFRLVLNEEPLSYAQRLAVYKSVSTHPKQVSALMRDGLAKDRLLVDFRTRAARLIEFFDTVKQTDAKVAKVLWIELVIPIVTEWKVLDCDVLTEFLVSALRIAPPSVLGMFAKALADTPSILERLVSDQAGSKRIQDWSCTLNATVKDPATLEVWTNRIVAFCEGCPNGHGATSQTKRWWTLVTLKAALKGVAERSGEGKTLPPNHLPLLAGMRELAEGDKKSLGARRLQNSAQYSFDLPLDIADAVKAFGMAVPTSERALQILIESLEKEETLSILVEVIGTFPCRPCHDIANRLSEAAQTVSGDQNLQSTDNLGLGLHEKRIGVWKVSLSAPALKDLRKLGLSGSDVFALAEAKLRDLGSGCWRGLSNLAGSPHQRSQLRVELLRAAVSRKLFILWQIDVGFDEVTSCVQQLIRVWKVDTNEEVSRAINRVAILQKCYGDVLVQQCRLRPPKDPDGKFIPAKFPRGSEVVISADSGTKMDVRSTDKEVIEMSNKFYSLTEPVINSILSNDVEAEFPFDISEEEVKIIRHFDSASLILGRSGTGKTTCLVYKLLGKYLARKSVPGEEPIRQVLLTRSDFLSVKLRLYIKKLIEAQTSKALSLSGSHQPEDISETEDGLAVDSVSTLKNELFPLVCTFDQFLRILENTVREADRKCFSPLGELTAKDPHSSGLADQIASIYCRNYTYNRKSQIVDFQTFKVDYWGRLPRTRHLPIEVVFAEIMGIIKGSTSSRDSLRPLSREEYLSRSHRQVPLFALESERSRVYDLYEAYEGLKREFGDVDNIDRVVNLLKAIQVDKGLRERLRVSFDEVYIDEVQDQRSLDIELLLNVVRDARGFHLAGDTAQSISKDSTFRFADIKALFYDHFSSVSEVTNQADLAKPTQFVLSKNYRSHQGILALASLVMKMLSTG